MLILVTGSEGIIGKYLVGRLKITGNTVYTIDKEHSDDPMHFKADVGNYRELLWAMSEICKKENSTIDHVYHLAAEVARLSGEIYYDKIWQSNAIGVRNILDLQIKGLFNRLIFFSSSEIYGDIEAPLLQEDMVEKHPVFPRNDYGLSKWVNEIQIKNHVNITSLPVTIIRIFTAYCKTVEYTPYRGVLYDFVWKALHDKHFTVYANYTRTFIYMTDFIDTVSRISTENIEYNGCINVGTNELVSMKELSDKVIEQTGCSKELADIKEFDSPLTIKHKNPDLTIAKKVLGHNPTITLDEGISRVIDAYKKKM